MRKIKVIGSFIVLHSGKVRLNQTQAKAREHGVKLVKEDIYEITGPVGFKHGEVFFYDGEIGKSHVEDVEDEAAKKKAAETAKKKNGDA